MPPFLLVPVHTLLDKVVNYAPDSVDRQVSPSTDRHNPLLQESRFITGWSMHLFLGPCSHRALPLIVGITRDLEGIHERVERRNHSIRSGLPNYP